MSATLCRNQIIALPIYVVSYILLYMPPITLITLMKHVYQQDPAAPSGACLLNLKIYSLLKSESREKNNDFWNTGWRC